MNLDFSFLTLLCGFLFILFIKNVVFVVSSFDVKLTTNFKLHKT